MWWYRKMPKLLLTQEKKLQQRQKHLIQTNPKLGIYPADMSLPPARPTPTPHPSHHSVAIYTSNQF